MQVQTIALQTSSPGQRHHLTLLRFGQAGAGPKAYIQAALHADEVPAMLVAQQLRQQLLALEAAGQLCGEVLLLPYANPLGLSQLMLGHHHGRFDLRDGVNFNRGFADLADAAADALAGRLGDDEATNLGLVRQALRDAAGALQSQQPAQDLKHKLLQLAIDADVVLDMHCDAQATMHLYTLTPHSALGAELGALLGAQAVLVADNSGDWPFDEACSRPWAILRERLAPHPVPLGCFSATLELRGEADTDHALAAQDAQAIIEFLRRRGTVAGTPAPLPAALCLPTPLAGSEPVAAPSAGVVVFRASPGDRLDAGALVAEVVDTDSGEVTPVLAKSAGMLYARVATRWATPGKRLAKIAGSTLTRTGKLLSP